MVAPWTMTDEGEFILNEPYKSQLIECKLGATSAWQDNIFSYLAERTPYTVEQMKDELNRRVDVSNMKPTELVDTFIIEALAGDL